MTLTDIRELAQPFVNLASAIVLSGIGVAFVTEALKDYRIPIPVQRYPRASAAILSVLATLVSLYAMSNNVLLTNPVQWLGLVLVIFAASAFAYNNIVRGLDGIKKDAPVAPATTDQANPVGPSAPSA